MSLVTEHSEVKDLLGQGDSSLVLRMTNEGREILEKKKIQKEY